MRDLQDMRAMPHFPTVDLRHLNGWRDSLFTSGRDSAKQTNYTTCLVFPVSHSYTQPLIVTLSGTSFVPFRYLTSSSTAASSSGKGKKSNLDDFSSCAASAPRFFSTM